MSLVETREENGVTTIVLNRPEKLNAFIGSMRDELIERLGEAASSEGSRAVVLTGAGRAFCSGGDVGMMRELQSSSATEEFSKLLEAGARVVRTIRSMPKPVIASINGVAAGAGCNLALACDYRIAADSAQLGETFVRIGLHPDWGGSWFLPRLVGPGRALEIMMTGRMVPAEEALEIGMIDRIVPSERLAEETRVLAAAIAAGPPIAIAALKRSLQASESNTMEAQIALENEIQLEAFQSADAAEGMRAFFEKRTPRFTGR